MIDLSGQKFGRLTVIRFVEFTKFRNAKFLCACECGTAVVVSSANLRRNITKSCGCLRREISGEYNRLSSGESAFNLLFWRYGHKAKQRGLVFDISKELFRTLTKMPCYYCGDLPHKVFKVNKRVGYYIYNGIDRIDNAVGYIETNCVPCCYICNVMKSTLSQKDFIDHIKKILERYNNV